MTHLKTVIKGRYSLSRVLLAICTCGLSLPFAWIRKRTAIITQGPVLHHPVVPR